MASDVFKKKKCIQSRSCAVEKAPRLAAQLHRPFLCARSICFWFLECVEMKSNSANKYMPNHLVAASVNVHRYISTENGVVRFLLGFYHQPPVDFHPPIHFPDANGRRLNMPACANCIRNQCGKESCVCTGFYSRDF